MKARPVVFVVSTAFALLLALSCGGGGDQPDPEQALHTMVDALNSGDIQTFYNGLSADRRASTSEQDVRAALDRVRALVGNVPKIEVTSVTGKRVDGDSAEVDTTLTVKLGPGIPVTDIASFKWEQDAWHLADHFLDQALGVLGLNQAPPSRAAAPSATR